MNTNRGFVIGLRCLSGFARGLLLCASAFLSALPFVVKSLDVSAVSALAGIFGWCGMSYLFVTLFDSEKTLKGVLYSLFCFFFAFYFFVYSWFISLYPLDFAGLGKGESIGVIIIALVFIPLLHSAVMTLCVFVSYLSARCVKSEFLKSVLVSAGYVLGEYMQSVGTFAFPWARLFVGQTGNVYVLQSASLFGSYFITFIMVLVNALVAFALVNVGKNNKKSAALVAVAVVIFSLNMLFGFVRVNTFAKAEHKTVSAVILQGNIPSGQKWSPDADERRVYLDLAKKAASYDADIAVMPETAFPVTLKTEDDYVSAYEAALMEISYVTDAQLFAGAFFEKDDKSYNSVFVFSPDGEVSPPYNKHSIVPFGEFLPYRNIIEKLVPSLSKINMLSTDIERGESFSPVETQVGRAACLVCFDSIFPENARKQIKGGGEFIVVATNDSWYKTSSALYQHADHAIMRAVENGVPVFRCANTGISRIIDPFGRIKAQTKANERCVLYGEAEIYEIKTLYTKLGDIIIPLCAVLIAAFLIMGIVKNKASRT